MIHATDIIDAYKISKPDLNRTPMAHSPELSKISGANVFLKMEFLQYTGSFKIRGVLTKIRSLDKSVFDKTFVAASTGNHAAAFGYASEKFGFKGVLFLPKKTSDAKIKALEQYGMRVIFYGENSLETEEKATAYAKDINGVLIHPYNDPEIIKGQGTIAVEIEEQVPEVNTILTPVGGGGLASGISTYFSTNDSVSVIGCQPKNASEMYLSIKQNGIVPPSTLSTIADASAGGIENNAITYDICKKHLSGFEIIEEEDIKKAVAFMMKYHKVEIEPTAALPVAALLQNKAYHGKNVVLVVTGKKIDNQLLTQIMVKYGDYY
ncbi:threonine ammonia-lyase [Aquimarina megaterium]|uniref:threonine ammonia-lyase n=1 Tax=Aquimarina megaterium TaxID=1443666 RepID=UPI0009424D6A|nr:threonine/serine dehydratase [Aquimarina megaterium]